MFNTKKSEIHQIKMIRISILPNDRILILLTNQRSCFYEPLYPFASNS